MFEKIIGHDDKKVILHDDVKNNKVSHAYLFVGPKGVGKYQVAKEFAKEILKTDNLDTCADYKYITKREDKKDILVEQIRKDVIDDIYLAPVAGDKKVYIIDEAEFLNTASQNTLLKTLEEPPTYVVIILISSSTSSFLPTIISRVNIMNFSNIDNEKLDKYIKEKYNVYFDKNILSFIDGSLGQATSIINNNLLDEFNNINKVFEYIKVKDVVSTFKLLENIKFNDNTLDYLEYLLYTNSLILSTKFVEKAKNRLKMNGNYDIVIDNMILNIIDSI